ncbi:2-oxoglutarate dehydrogenase complex component E1 [Dendroctonus ponderosae]|nr:2-oxoglutarate dehydrogenase complex component E1 [Dendroctonus ponderosae]KAH1024835.1 hypothetical protein HUJ05_004266 [Dendroctonus ponderosae]
MFGYLASATGRLWLTASHGGKSRIFSTSPNLADQGVPTPAVPPLDGSSASYLEDMYNSWLNDPKSVHSSWDAYFRHSQSGETGYMRPPSFALPSTLGYLSSSKAAAGAPASAPTAAAATAATPQTIQEHLTVQAIIRNYQMRGHLAARLNPLEPMFEIEDKTSTISEQLGKPPPEVINQHKLEPSMWETSFKLPSSTMIGGSDGQTLSLKEIIKRLELTYCRHVGLEYMHINDPEQCSWIRERFEVPGVTELKKPEKRLLLTRLAKAVLFEAFLQKKWSSEKRFGLEGCEVLIPCIKTIIDECAKRDAEMAIIGMAHRGRLNVIANVCQKPLNIIFSQFRGLQAEDEGAGDVKYHLGVYNNRELPASKKPFTTVLVANPSHLEMVNPVCAGRARAEQFYRNDPEGKKVITIVMHGDAAICGEGIVYETINFANLSDYHNGGTIHFVVNNQVGFTTDPEFSRSSLYSTEVGKVVGAPIFHVNADDPESAAYVAKVAAEFRSKFHKDVVIDLIGYRRHGHNEADEPMFTQPFMYQKIKKMPNIFEKYSAAAIKQGVVSEAEVKEFKDQTDKILEEEFGKAAKLTSMRFADWIDCPWPGFFKKQTPLKCMPTGVSLEALDHIANKFAHLPSEDFELHKALMRVMHMRQEMVKNHTADWAIGEALAIGSLLQEGTHVRLSGQDVQRGTFSHRHHTVHHQSKANTKYTYLKDLHPNQAPYSICNSPISEYGILGFEHGYSMANPGSLVIWEAQFGDFANNAQPIFDCMVASGQWKWVRQCGLVVLLPHGLEGQGPEHSSTRVERFLQLSSDDPDFLPPDDPDYVVRQLRDINWIIANCTTPANLFHVLRRQIKLPFRKPLLICTPKSLLRHPEARSKFDEMIDGTEFKRIIPATGPASENADNVKKLVFCSGKVYYDFMKEAKEKKIEDKIAIARVEQICPFPYDLVQQEAKKYHKAQIAWGQEEHKNSGCWTYVNPRFETALKGERDILYIGRAPSASTASGNKIQYQKEYESLLEELVKNCQ